MANQDMALAALARLDEIAPREGAKGMGDICTQYKQIKPILKAALPYIKMISPRVAAVIETLMGLLDGLCA